MKPGDPNRENGAAIYATAGALMHPARPLITFVEPFLADQCNVRESSIIAYRGGLRRFITWLGERGLLSATRETIIAYKRDMESQSLSANSLSTYLVVVRKFFEWLEGMKLYPNVAKGVKGAKTGRGFKKDCLTREQAIELLAGIDRSTLLGKRDFALVNLLIRTGLRTVEVARANVADIRQEGGEARLLIQGKGRDSKDDFVLLTQPALRPLRAYLQDRGVLDDAGPLFVSLSDRCLGGRLTTRTIRRIVKDGLREIGLDSNRLTAHSLRHTAVTFSLRGGASLQDAQAMARHASINTTMVYSHNVKRFDQAGERKIDAWLDSNVAEEGCAI